MDHRGSGETFGEATLGRGGIGKAALSAAVQRRRRRGKRAIFSSLSPYLASIPLPRLYPPTSHSHPRPPPFYPLLSCIQNAQKDHGSPHSPHRLLLPEFNDIFSVSAYSSPLLPLPFSLHPPLSLLPLLPLPSIWGNQEILTQKKHTLSHRSMLYDVSYPWEDYTYPFLPRGDPWSLSGNDSPQMGAIKRTGGVGERVVG